MAHEKKQEESVTIDFVGIGAEKAGTSWVSENLAEHPDICLSEPKEIQFFNEKTNFTYPRREHGNFEKGLEWYKRFYSHCDKNTKIRGEFSTHHIIDQRAASRIYQLFPKAKIILCLRNPVDRTISHYKWHRYVTMREKRDFIDALKNEPEYINASLYAQNLSAFQKKFPAEQIHYIFFDDIVNKPREVMEKIHIFLGVEKTFISSIISSKKRVNKARKTKHKWLSELVNTAYAMIVRLRLNRAAHYFKRMGLKSWLEKINSENVPEFHVSPQEKKLIWKKVQNDVIQLEKTLNIDLSRWRKYS